MAQGVAGWLDGFWFRFYYFNCGAERCPGLENMRHHLSAFHSVLVRIGCLGCGFEIGNNNAVINGRQSERVNKCQATNCNRQTGRPKPRAHTPHTIPYTPCSTFIPLPLDEMNANNCGLIFSNVC